ncbi:MAG TPA: STAS domain-containing protein, partial [Calditrichaeota bacterium]|nr:STAS domain-containing protein [Calditrichota bacterium]
MQPFQFELPETFDFNSAESVYKKLKSLINGDNPPSSISIDFKHVKIINSAGAAVVDRL